MVLNRLSQFGNIFQVKVLSLLLTDPKFLQTVNDIFSSDYFDSPSHKWIIEQTLKFYKKYHTTPSVEFLNIETKKLENEVLQISIVEQLREAYHSPKDDQQYVKDEFINFCKNQQLKTALLSSVDLLNAGMYDDIRGLINNALKAGKEKNLGHEYLKDIEARYRIDARKIVPTPWETINNLIQGGLGEGDLGLLFGSPGGGKSWMLTAIGAYAAMMGFNVNHYTLELGEAYVGLRYDALFSQIPVDRVVNHRAEVEEKLQGIKGKIVIKEFPMYKASIHTLESHLNQCVDEGHNPDLILIDYIDLLRSPKTRKDKKEEIDDNYAAVKGWAKEIHKPIWSPSQVNRAGAGDDIIEGDKIASSYDKLMIADLSLSLSRKKKDKQEGTGRVHVMKNRYGMDGMTYNITMDTSMGNIEFKSSFDGDEDYTPPPKSQFSNDITSVDKKELKNKFFELQHQ